MKKFLAMLLALMMVFSLVACGETEAPAATEAPDAKEEPVPTPEVEAGPEYTEIELKLGTSSAEGSLVANTLIEFGNKLSEATDGKVTVTVYPGSVLGSTAEMLQNTQIGTLDLAVQQPGGLADMGAKKLTLLTLPYLIKDYDTLIDVLFSDIGDELLQDITDNIDGLIGFGYLPDGGRCYFTNSAIRSLDDIKGMKLRMQSFAIDTDTANTLGFSATPIAMSELYSSLESGVIDGAENSISTIDGSKFYEVIKYVTLDNHIFNLPVMMVSESTWNKLSDDTKAIMKEVWDANVLEYYVPQLTETQEEMLAKFEENGVEIIELEDYDKWVEAVQPVWDKYDDGIEDLVEQVLNMQ